MLTAAKTAIGAFQGNCKAGKACTTTSRSRSSGSFVPDLNVSEPKGRALVCVQYLPLAPERRESRHAPRTSGPQNLRLTPPPQKTALTSYITGSNRDDSAAISRLRFRISSERSIA